MHPTRKATMSQFIWFTLCQSLLWTGAMKTIADSAIIPQKNLNKRQNVYFSLVAGGATDVYFQWIT
jgi:hypothetical protein